MGIDFAYTRTILCVWTWIYLDKPIQSNRILVIIQLNHTQYKQISKYKNKLVSSTQHTAHWYIVARLEKYSHMTEYEIQY